MQVMIYKFYNRYQWRSVVKKNVCSTYYPLRERQKQKEYHYRYRY